METYLNIVIRTLVVILYVECIECKLDQHVVWYNDGPDTVQTGFI